MELPKDQPCQIIGSDIFVLNGENYLITVDYYSNFYEIDKLTNISS